MAALSHAIVREASLPATLIDAAKLLHPSLALGDSVFYCVLAVHILLSYSEIKIFPESSAQRCETTRLTQPFGCTRATNRLDWLLAIASTINSGAFELSKNHHPQLADAGLPALCACATRARR